MGSNPNHALVHALVMSGQLVVSHADLSKEGSEDGAAAVAFAEAVAFAASTRFTVNLKSCGNGHGTGATREKDEKKVEQGATGEGESIHDHVA